MINTWKSVRQRVPDGISDETLETVRRASGHLRHMARIRYVLELAKEWLCDPGDSMPHLSEEERQEIRNRTYSHVRKALCYLDARGLYGGGDHQPGVATRRHPAFASIPGHHTRVGLAWDDALMAAAFPGRFAVDLKVPVPTLVAIRYDPGHPKGPWVRDWEVKLRLILPPEVERVVLLRVAAGKEHIWDVNRKSDFASGPPDDGYVGATADVVHRWLPDIARRLETLRAEEGGQ